MRGKNPVAANGNLPSNKINYGTPFRFFLQSYPLIEKSYDFTKSKQQTSPSHHLTTSPSHHLISPASPFLPQLHIHFFSSTRQKSKQATDKQQHTALYYFINI
jgi:hypothetical protein